MNIEDAIFSLWSKNNNDFKDYKYILICIFFVKQWNQTWFKFPYSLLI